MIPFQFLPAAWDEMAHAARFYQGQANGLGYLFLEDVRRVIDSLRQFPESGQAIPGNLRRTMVSRFPFSIVYSVDLKKVVIVAVAHHRRQPDYWRDRTRK